MLVNHACTFCYEQHSKSVFKLTCVRNDMCALIEAEAKDAAKQGSAQKSPRGLREGSPGDEEVGNAFAVAGALADDLVPASAEEGCTCAQTML